MSLPSAIFLCLKLDVHVLLSFIEGIKAAFAVCGEDKPFTATFTGGASEGNVNVSLEQI